jgi:hypothetical protein
MPTPITKELEDRLRQIPVFQKLRFEASDLKEGTARLTAPYDLTSNRAHPSIPRIRGSEQVLVLDADLISPPTNVITEVAPQVALAGNERRHGRNRDIIAVDRDEGPVVTGSGRVRRLDVRLSGCLDVRPTWPGIAL